MKFSHLTGMALGQGLLLAGLLAVAVPVAQARVVVRGGFGSYAGYRHFGYYGGYYPGVYYPGFHGGYPVVARSPHGGQVKLDTRVKNAEVFINGSFAGTVGQLKSFYLRAGSYDLELRAPDGARFHQRVYVVAGQTLHLRPALS